MHLQTIKSTQNLLLEKDAVAVVNLVADDIVSPGVYRVSKVFVGVEKPLAHAELNPTRYSSLPYPFMLCHNAV